MSALRIVVAGLLVVLAVNLQIGFFPHLAIDGVVPDVALLVVVGAGLVRGPEYAAALGLAAGLALDLAPPADHTAGRWALALVVAGYLSGMVRRGAYRSGLAAVVTVAASAFIATSVFAFSGLALGDPGVSVERALSVLPIAILYDVLLTPLVVPAVAWLLQRIAPIRQRWAYA